MNSQVITDYQRIESAIEYIRTHYRQQPLLEDIAAGINLSPFHFQKLFTEWAGISPKKFLQYISLAHAKSMLREKQASLFDAAFETGLSGTGRLHDLFISIEGMTPGEYKTGGAQLNINYDFHETTFGKVIAASTGKGLCYLAFLNDEEEALQLLKNNFPAANFKQHTDQLQDTALKFFSKEEQSLSMLKLHLKGTPFQLKVWEALLKIPMGELRTYAAIAGTVDNLKASRAVGTAIGDNPVAFLIPCHRVIRTTGELGGYHWGLTRKTAMIGWEAAATDVEQWSPDTQVFLYLLE